MEILRDAHREVTGKNPTLADAERYWELARALVAELKAANAKTDITSPPAFLAAHLKRRFAQGKRRKRLSRGYRTPLPPLL